MTGADVALSIGSATFTVDDATYSLADITEIVIYGKIGRASCRERV